MAITVKGKGIGEGDSEGRGGVRGTARIRRKGWGSAVEGNQRNIYRTSMSGSVWVMATARTEGS